MKVLGIIPARKGSKRLAGKNLRALSGKPLVQWAIDNALNSSSLDSVAVSSDDEQVLSLAQSLGVEHVIRRPAELCEDESSAVEYVLHTLQTVESLGQRYDAVAIVQATSPLTLPSDINATVTLLETSKADSAVTVVKLDHAVQPLKLKYLKGDRLVPLLEDEKGRMASHQLPAIYVRNGSVYATRTAVIGQGQILGEDCRAHIMPRTRSIDINDDLDLLFAEFLHARLDK